MTNCKFWGWHQITTVPLTAISEMSEAETELQQHLHLQGHNLRQISSFANSQNMFTSKPVLTQSHCISQYCIAKIFNFQSQ